MARTISYYLKFELNLVNEITINNLEDDILILILEKLEVKDLVKFEQVNKHWFILIQKIFRGAKNLHYLSIPQSVSETISHVVRAKMHNMIVYDNEIDVFVNIFQRTRNLRTIDCNQLFFMIEHGPEAHFLYKVLTYFTRLQEIYYITEYNIQFLTNYLLKLQAQLPNLCDNLKSIHIKMVFKESQADNQVLKYTKLIKNLLKIAKNLDSFYVHIEIDRSRLTSKSVKKLEDLLTLIANKAQRLTLDYGAVSFLLPISIRNKKLKELEIYRRPRFELNLDNEAPILVANTPYLTKFFTYSSSAVLNLYSGYKNLTDFSFHSTNPLEPKDVEAFLKKCGTALKKLFFGMPAGILEEINLAHLIVKFCPNLTILTLQCVNVNINQLIGLDQLKELMLMDNNLTKFKIDSIFKYRYLRRLIIATWKVRPSRDYKIIKNYILKLQKEGAAENIVVRFREL